jgi:hypothetical protein
MLPGAGTARARVRPGPRAREVAEALDPEERSQVAKLVAWVKRAERFRVRWICEAIAEVLDQLPQPEEDPAELARLREKAKRIAAAVALELEDSSLFLFYKATFLSLFYLGLDPRLLEGRRSILSLYSPVLRGTLEVLEEEDIVRVNEG